MKNILKAAILAALTSASIWSAATAHDGATGIVKERMEAMKSVSERMKEIAKMMKGETEYNAQRVSALASEIANHGDAEMTSKFPENSIHGPSEALPVIWEDWDGFTTLARSQNQKADALSSAALSDPGTRPIDAFKALAKTCKSCHDDFRRRN